MLYKADYSAWYLNQKVPHVIPPSLPKFKRSPAEWIQSKEDAVWYQRTRLIWHHALEEYIEPLITPLLYYIVLSSHTIIIQCSKTENTKTTYILVAAFSLDNNMASFYWLKDPQSQLKYEYISCILLMKPLIILVYWAYISWSSMMIPDKSSLSLSDWIG